MDLVNSHKETEKRGQKKSPDLWQSTEDVLAFPGPQLA